MGLRAPGDAQEKRVGIVAGLKTGCTHSKILTNIPPRLSIYKPSAFTECVPVSHKDRSIAEEDAHKLLFITNQAVDLVTKGFNFHFLLHTFLF